MHQLSVVVAAHNDERALPSCLAALVEQSGVRLHVVVVANGCSDGTVAAARAAVHPARARDHEIEVIELPDAGKAAALNAGDERCATGPRLYLDADVQLGPGAAFALASALQPGTGVNLAAPTIRVVAPTRWLAASYVRLWSELPYVRTQVLGCGAFAVSEVGRRRWGRFPNLLSDDRFARLHFDVGEQLVITSSWFMMAFPEDPRELLAARGRWCTGNRQLARRLPALAARDTARVLPGLAHVVQRPSCWRDVPVFVVLFAYGRLRALRDTDAVTWDRETSSVARAPTPVDPTVEPTQPAA